MLELILTALEQLGIEKYEIREKKTESLECFFIRKGLDLKRRTDTTDYAVCVYREFEKDGKRMLGSSECAVHPGETPEEIRETLENACRAAALVCNPYYELYEGRREAFVPSAGSFARAGMEESMKKITEALFAADREEDVFLNSAEVFVRHHLHHILNSSGVDVSYEVYDVWGEYVVQCTAPQDVETYHQFSYQDMETDALRRDVEEALAETRARAQAAEAPEAGVYDVILSGVNVRTFLDYYLSRSNTAMVYQNYSDYQPGTQVQGEEVCGDRITLTLAAREPYSPEGIPMKDRVLIRDGKLELLHGGVRFARYLGVEPTGRYRKLTMPLGNVSLAEMKSRPCLHVVSFSDFQMDDFTGHFGGEIRLAFLCDGEKEIPVTGGSINGSLLEAQGHLTFSRESYRSVNYEGPFAVRIQGVQVAGK